MYRDPFRAIIIDDETPAREELIHLLDHFKDVEISASAKDGFEAINILKTTHIDIAFLDIQMPGLNGIEVAKQIKSLGLSTIIIFTTAYDNFAIDAFDVHAVDYLLKPIRLEKLTRSIDRALEELKGDRLENIIEHYVSDREKNRYSRLISVYNGDQIIPLKIDSVLFVEARGRYVWLITGKGEFKSNLNFRDAEEIFSSPLFFKCHRSFIVNTESIEAIDLWVNNSYRIKIRGLSTSIPVSRKHKTALQRLIGI